MGEVVDWLCSARLYGNCLMRWFQKSTAPEVTDRLAQMQHWMTSGSGQSMLQMERQHIEHELNYIFGYHGIEMSVAPEANLLATSQVSRCFKLNPSPVEGTESQMISDLYHWPVSPGSLDLVLLHHIVEASDRPHRLLSEAANSIISGGKMIVVGFNPCSLVSLTGLLNPNYRKLFSGTHFISVSRMRDWLTLLGFKVESVNQGAYLYPLSRRLKGLSAELVEQRCSHWTLPFGGFYIMVATREVPGMTPIKQHWSPMGRSFVTNPVPGSSRVPADYRARD